MNDLLSFWLPICAFIISFISLGISISNMMFSRKYEAAKKRTELMVKILRIKTILKEKKANLFKVKDICKNCPKGAADHICSSYENDINKISELYQKIDDRVNVSDPIPLELILAKIESYQTSIQEYVDGIDGFIENISKCEKISQLKDNR